MPIRAIRKAELGDGFVGRHLTRSGITANEGMATHEEQMKEQDRETEGIVIVGTNYSPERLALELGRGKERLSDVAREYF
jgi:hypothetical protein